MSTPPAPTPQRSDRLLLAVLLLGCVFWMAQAHWEEIDLGKAEAKRALHERVLANEADDPYQYKLWLVSHAFAWTQRTFDMPLEDVFLANTLLSLLVLVMLHFLWLRSLVDERTALFGTVLLAALAHCLFRIHYHHPYEFWGVALYCLLLRAVQRDADWRILAGLALLTGLVWEKHALVPLLWGLYALQRRRPFVRSLLQGLAMLAAALAVPIALRLGLGTDRLPVDGDVPFWKQAWHKVLWYQAPYILPFLAILVLRFHLLPPWVRWLWLYLPTLALAYALKHYNLHEVRSFWAMAPVFTATACCWWAAPPAESTRAPA